MGNLQFNFFYRHCLDSLAASIHFVKFYLPEIFTIAPDYQNTFSPEIFLNFLFELTKIKKLK